MTYVNYQDGATALAIRIGGTEIVSSARELKNIANATIDGALVVAGPVHHSSGSASVLASSFSASLLAHANIVTGGIYMVLAHSPTSTTRNPVGIVNRITSTTYAVENLGSSADVVVAADSTNGIRINNIVAVDQTYKWSIVRLR